MVDKAAMEALLSSLIQQLHLKGVTVEFFITPQGDRKQTLLLKVPLKAIAILQNERNSIVIALPDLYPKNKAFPHISFQELEIGIYKILDDALRSKGIDDTRLKSRFKVFCFKHDLEALILAADDDALKSRLGVKTLVRDWTIPVEDQNQDKPPKKVVEQLFENYQLTYRGTVDAPIILGASNYQDIATRCPQCFKPFIDFLESL